MVQYLQGTEQHALTTPLCTENLTQYPNVSYEYPHLQFEVGITLRGAELHTNRAQLHSLQRKPEWREVARSEERVERGREE